jgi:hypothetical protein
MFEMIALGFRGAIQRSRLCVRLALLLTVASFLRMECPANSVPESMRQTGMVKGLIFPYQLEG